MEHTRRPSQTENKEALRSIYDRAYRLIYGREAFEEAVRTAFHNDHVRKTGRTIVIVGTVLLGIVLFLASSLIAQHLIWLNRPAPETLMAAPYGLSSQLIEEVSFATDSLTLQRLEEAGYRYISDNANLPLVNCLGSTVWQTEKAICPVSTETITSETALLLDTNNKSMTMVTATFEDEESAYTALKQLHEYSRITGLDGNFVLGRNQRVPYFYSQQGNNLNFAWKQSNTIYLLSASDTNAIDEIINTLLPNDL